MEKLDLLNLHKFAWASFQNTVTDYLVALKSLRFLVLDLSSYFDEDGLRAILNVCPPNVWIDCRVCTHYQDYDIDSLHVIGPRLQKFELEYESGTLPRDFLPVLGNIQELILSSWDEASDEMIESIFVEPLPCLQKLSFFSVKNPKVLCSIAGYVSNLRELTGSFSFSCSETDEKQIVLNGSPISELQRANEHLHYIIITYWHTKHIVDFIPRLRVCHSLEHVAIYYWPRSEDRTTSSEKTKEVTNACVALRTKSLSLSVDGMLYLPR